MIERGFFSEGFSSSEGRGLRLEACHGGCEAWPKDQSATAFESEGGRGSALGFLVRSPYHHTRSIAGEGPVVSIGVWHCKAKKDTVSW